MIENLAVVLERHNHQVRLATSSPTGCAKCDRGEGCGGGVFGKLIQRRLSGLLLPDPDLNLQPGQTVVLGLPAGVFLQATAAVYLLPLLMLLLFALPAAGWFRSDALVAVAGISGLLLGAWLGPRLRQRFIDAQLQPRILRRAQADDLKICGAAGVAE